LHLRESRLRKRQLPVSWPLRCPVERQPPPARPSQHTGTDCHFAGPENPRSRNGS
jgi:hypothetical protein